MSIFSPEPSVRWEYNLNNTLKILYSTIENFIPDIIILNHRRTNWLFKYINIKFRIPIVYISHNAEEKCIYDLAKGYNNPIERFLALMEASKIRKNERLVISNSRLTVAISDEDKGLILSDDIKKSNIKVIPPYCSHGSLGMVDVSGDDIKLLLIGSFRWKPKLENARWLSYEIFPKIMKKFTNIELLIIGGDADKILNLSFDNKKY